MLFHYLELLKAEGGISREVSACSTTLQRVALYYTATEYVLNNSSDRLLLVEHHSKSGHHLCSVSSCS